MGMQHVGMRCWCKSENGASDAEFRQLGADCLIGYIRLIHICLNEF